MRGKIFLVLFFTIMIGIQPLSAQSGSDAAAKPAAPKKAVKETEIVINLASDDEFLKALEAAGDIELVNEGTAKTEETKSEASGKASSQEKQK